MAILGFLWDVVGNCGEPCCSLALSIVRWTKSCGSPFPNNSATILPCPPGGGLYVTPGTDGSLTLYTEAAFHLLGQRLAQSPPTRQDVRAFSRLFYGQAQHVELDRQGRIRIPPELATLAKLQNEVSPRGSARSLEIWALETLAKLCGRQIRPISMKLRKRRWEEVWQQELKSLIACLYGVRHLWKHGRR